MFSGRFFKYVVQQFAPSRERLIAQVFAFQKKNVEDVVNKRHTLLGAFDASSF